MTQWRALADRLKETNVRFIIEPDIRFEGEPGEQATFFILDPSGNALEFKAFDDDSRIFEK
jgi:extradiol dioxygenase family protein